MRTYYLFEINETFRKLYAKRTEYLFEILEQIYNSRTHEYKMLYHFFSQLVEPLEQDYVKKCLYQQYANIKICSDHVFELENIYTGEKTKILIGNTYIKIKTNILLPAIFKTEALDYFVCDFASKDYFWLKELHTKALV